MIDEGRPLLLDGATGTELNRRGVDTGLPLWSANALTTGAGLNVLRQVHLDYLQAGADILTTNTFRTNRRVLTGKGHSARDLTMRAVATVHEAVADFGQPAQVAGSLSCLEDCYLPDLVPSDEECHAEHSERIHHLVEGGVDLLLIEAMNKGGSTPTTPTRTATCNTPEPGRRRSLAVAVARGRSMSEN
jgi:S-methylmethionine-dependent homocysteine/selenocysteine methylase